MQNSINLQSILKAASYTEDEPKNKKKNWIQRNPLLAGLIGAGLAGAGYKYVQSGKAEEHLNKLKQKLGDSALADTSVGRALGLDKYRDFDPTRLDKSKFGEEHKPGSISEKFMNEVRRKGKLTTTSDKLIAEKTGMSAEEAKKYINNVRKARDAAEENNKLMGSANVMPSRSITMYHDMGRMSKDMGWHPYLGRHMARLGPFSTFKSLQESDNKKGLEMENAIYIPDFDFAPLATNNPNAKENGLFNKNVDGQSVKDITSTAQILGHEASHAKNTSLPNDGYGWNFFNNWWNGTAQRTNRPTDETKIMRDVQNAFLNNGEQHSDYTYPLHGTSEATQSLASMKQLAIALNGGKAPKTDAGWRKAFNYIAQQSPETLEQFRFQSYLTPQNMSKDVAQIYKKQNVNKLMDILLKKDLKGVSALDQLAFKDNVPSKAAYNTQINRLINNLRNNGNELSVEDLLDKHKRGRASMAALGKNNGTARLLALLNGARRDELPDLVGPAAKLDDQDFLTTLRTMQA